MEKKAHITAEWARKTADSIMNDKSEKYLAYCLDKIEKAVNGNKMSVTISDFIDGPVKKELETRGFKIQPYDDPREGAYTVINW
jgi:hypothetical protein